jgi:peroxiredoxin Q/BCP
MPVIKIDNAAESLPCPNKNVVIFFYVKDFGTLCTLEAISFRDKIEFFDSFGVEVVGVSRDTPETHKIFAEKFQLPFTLVSDERDKLRSLLGLRNFMKCRTTVVIDRDGKERLRYCSMFDPVSHVREALRAVSEI